jgi:hypothetical protein
MARVAGVNIPDKKTSLGFFNSYLRNRQNHCLEDMFENWNKPRHKNWFFG